MREYSSVIADSTKFSSVFEDVFFSQFLIFKSSKFRRKEFDHDESRTDARIFDEVLADYAKFSVGYRISFAFFLANKNLKQIPSFPAEIKESNYVLYYKITISLKGTSAKT